MKKKKTAFLKNIAFPAGLEIEHKTTWVQLAMTEPQCG